MEQRETTRLRILETIRDKGPIARTEIAVASDASPATVTSVTADLIASGLVEEVPLAGENSQGRRGRPRVHLKLRPRSAIVAGAKVGRHAISVLLSDFEGSEIVSTSIPLAAVQMPPDALVEALSRAVDAACAEAGLSPRDIAALSIGIAGLVDSKRSFVHWSWSLEGRGVELGALLDRSFGFPTFLENDANMVAKAEQLFGEGRGCENFLVVTIEHGVGLGIILDGQLYRGASGCGAEFGHTKLQLHGALCQCGQRGCLEAYVGDYALIREVSIDNRSKPPKTVEEIKRRAKSGDAIASAVLERAGQMFGMGLVNLVHLFDPERIILAGAQTRFEHLHSENVMRMVREASMRGDTALPEIIVNQWGDVMWAKGAAAHALQQVMILRTCGTSHAA